MIQIERPASMENKNDGIICFSLSNEYYDSVKGYLISGDSCDIVYKKVSFVGERANGWLKENPILWMAQRSSKVMCSIWHDYLLYFKMKLKLTNLPCLHLLIYIGAGADEPV